MVYVGHFSFDDHRFGTASASWHGLFTLVAEASNVGAAVQKFNRLIRDLAKRDDLFDGVSEIFLDSCVELRTIPRSGLLTYVTVRQGEDTGGISASLLRASPRVATAYGWGSHADAGSIEPHRVKPFLRLRGRPKTAQHHEAAPATPLPPTRRSEKIH